MRQTPPGRTGRGLIARAVSSHHRRATQPDRHNRNASIVKQKREIETHDGAIRLGSIRENGTDMKIYVGEPNKFANGRPTIVPQGHVLGGGSSVNGMVYIRGHSNDYDQWSQLRLQPLVSHP